MRRLAGVACIVLSALAGPGATGEPASTHDHGFESARALVARLRARGRAEAVFEASVASLTGAPRRTRGRLALEPPDRSRLEFPATGEVVTLRGDGGEWLQPANHQMLKFGSANATPVLRWWTLFMEGGSSRFRERRIAARLFELSPVAAGEGSGSGSGARDSAAPESTAGGADMVARVWLGSDGLPIRLELTSEGAASADYRLSEWRFTRPRGREAFVLEPPPGIEVVDLP